MNDVIKNKFKQIRKLYEEAKELNQKNLIIKILLIVLFSNLKLSFNSLKFDLNIAKKIKKLQNILPIENKSKIITIGFYDIIHCDQRWRRLKKGYFYELPKYADKFLWVFLAKNGVY